MIKFYLSRLFNKMTEKSYYLKLNKYYIKYAKEILHKSVAWEAKFTRTNYINFKCLAAHQEERLLEAEGVYGQKLADVGLARKAFDGFVLFEAKSFFVAIYFKPNKTLIYQIPIRAFIKEKYAGKEKSLSIERANQIGKLIRI